MSKNAPLGKRVLAVITARGGSKGLPNKNILPIAGKPLVSWTIEAAKDSQLITHLIVSSDDNRIIEIAKDLRCDAPFIRPSELAQDNSSNSDVLLHALNFLDDEFDYIVLLQATSPMRLGKDIDRCIELCMKEDTPAAVSLTEPDKSPYWMYQLDDEHRIRALYPELNKTQRRQLLPPAYAPNGAVYVAEVSFFKKHKTFYTDLTKAYLMPKERSVDVDSHLDRVVAEALLKNKA